MLPFNFKTKADFAPSCSCIVNYLHFSVYVCISTCCSVSTRVPETPVTRSIVKDARKQFSKLDRFIAARITAKKNISDK